MHSGNTTGSDELDWRIIYELDRDASQSLADIGSSVGAARDVVHYRIKKLEKEGIIKTYYTLIDYGKLGYFSCTIYVKLQRENAKTRNELSSYIKEDPRIFQAAFCSGNFDFAMKFRAKNMQEIKDIESSFLQTFAKNVKEIKITQNCTVSLFSRAYLNKKTKEKKKFSFVSIPNKIADAKDEKIIALVSNNSKLGQTGIAKKLRITPAQVFYGLKTLQERKIILAMRALLDIGRLGYETFKADFYLEDFSQKEKLSMFIVSHPNVVAAYDTLNGAHVEAELEVLKGELEEFLEQVREKFGESLREIEVLRYAQNL